MATTTTHYGFDIPQSTDLVKDGATAIATLGQDIDTAMNTALGTKKAGMVLLNTTSFSGVSSQTFTGLTSTYSHFRILIKLTGSSAATQDIRLRLSLNGTAATGTDYTFRGIRVMPTVLASNGDVETSWFINAHSNSAPANFGSHIDLLNLSEATRTNILCNSFAYDGSVHRYNTTYGIHNVATAYNEVVLFASTGNIDGTASIFGYNK